MTKQRLPKSLDDLIEQGEEDGFLVQDDIFLIYPEPEKHIQDIDDFFDKALKKGIDIFETVSTREEEDAKKSAEEIEREIKQLLSSRHGESLDPIKKYLKEIEREEDDNDDTENGSDFSELERRLANLKNRCNADSIESLIEKAKTVRAELQQAKAEGDHIKAARLLVEMRGIVEQSKHLSDVCERMSKISTKLENVVAKRVAIIRTGTSTASNTEARMTATIEITSTEFKPNAVTIKKGGNVTWVNKDNNAHWPASARHPTHTVYPGSGIEKCGSGEKIFDACDGLSKDETFVFQFNEIGKWNYHDHLDSSLFGSVTVVE